MKHLSQDELVMQYYHEGSGAAANHLGTCEDCRARFQEVAQFLSVIRIPEPPPRSADYGSQVWHNLRPLLPEKPAPARVWWMLPRTWAAVGAVAVLIVAAFLAGRMAERTSHPQQAASAPAPQKVLLVALGDHLDRSEMLLVELSHADNPQDLDLAADRKTADELIASNRLYRQTALRVGDHGTAALLDQLERVLLEVAHQPDNPTAADLQQIRDQIQSGELLFKVRVVQLNVKDDLKDAVPAVTPSQARPTI